MSRPSASLPHIRGPADFARAFDVSRETTVRLETYARLLRQWQKAVNLVAPTTLDDVWHRHFADSAQLALVAPQARTWLDLGSGGGFPGLVVAIMLADQRAANEIATGPRVTLLEAHARKCAFLAEVARETGVAVDILSTRAEVAATQASLPPPEVVSARAVAPLDKLLGLAAPFCSADTVGLFLKGREAAVEVEAAQSLWTFEAELIPSRTELDARVVAIRHLHAKVSAKTKG